MAAPEYYVRGLNDTEARGPFSQEQLSSLVEAGQVTAETYFYDAATEQWLAIGSNAALKAALWPEKKKLGFKQAEFKAVNKAMKEGEKEITVQDFLAAAEGKTEETKGKKDKNLQLMHAAIWGTRGAAAIMLISSAALVLPGWEALVAFDLPKLLEKPVVFLGIADAVLGILLLLGVISIYPLVRFRAVFGLGFLGFLLWTQGNPTALLAVGAGAAGLYFSTIFLNYIPLAVAVLTGLGGMIALTSMSLF
ncbi:MAG: DUF4339 domain-containing protein [Opitutales bacterium]